jgi:hypothetical protein
LGETREHLCVGVNHLLPIVAMAGSPEGHLFGCVLVAFSRERV